MAFTAAKIQEDITLNVKREFNLDPVYLILSLTEY
jgi:hypothetical protein